MSQPSSLYTSCVSLMRTTSCRGAPIEEGGGRAEGVVESDRHHSQLVVVVCAREEASKHFRGKTTGKKSKEKRHLKLLPLLPPNE